MVYIGIDPGLISGAWAALDHNGAFKGCGDIPSADGRVDAIAFCQILHATIPPGDEACVIIEQVWCMPKQGISSTSKFMRATGCIEAVATLMRHPVHFVTPQKWKQYHNLLHTMKPASLALARSKWPTAPLDKAKHHGRAEALLLAEWGRETLS